jgi:hypothetical protein
VRVSVLNSSEAYVSNCLSWSFLLVFSPLPDSLGLYTYILYTSTCWADCHTIYLDCIICFILLSSVPVTCCSLQFQTTPGLVVTVFKYMDLLCVSRPCHFCITLIFQLHAHLAYFCYYFLLLLNPWWSKIEIKRANGRIAIYLLLNDWLSFPWRGLSFTITAFMDIVLFRYSQRAWFSAP